MGGVLLEVKGLKNAKKRLMSVLTPEERFGLAEAMLADTIRAVQGVRAAEKIFVVTNYGPVMNLAGKNGWEALREERQISERHSVDAPPPISHKTGLRNFLPLPLHLPPTH